MEFKELLNLLDTMGEVKTIKKISAEDINKYATKFDWRLVLDVKKIPVDIIIDNLSLIQFDNFKHVKSYLMKNRYISVQDLIKLRNAIIEWDGSIDDVLIFNKNISRKKYDKIVFGMDNETFFNFERLNYTSVEDLLSQYSFDEKILNKVVDVNTIPLILLYQKISEEFIIQNKFYLEGRWAKGFIKDYILNNKPDIEFVKKELFPIIKNIFKEVEISLKDNINSSNKKYIYSLINEMHK